MPTEPARLETVIRAGTQGAVAVVLDHPPRQPHPAQCRRLEGRRPSGVFRLARHHHVGALFLGAAAAGPRRGQAACEPGVSRDPVSVRAPDPREAGEFPRLQGRAILSVAHQGHRRRRFLDRLGRARRGADAVRLAGAGLRQGAWLDEGSPGGADDRARRRRRDGRGQHLRGAARRAGSTACAIPGGWSTTTARASTPWCARGCGRNSNPCSATSAGTW